MAYKVTIVDHYDEVMAVINADTLEKLGKAAMIVRDTARAECPVRTGALRRSLRIAVEKAAKAAKVIAGNKKAWYPHLVLFGTVERFTRGKGLHRKKKRSTGVIAPNNFLQRALDKNKSTLRGLFGKPITGHDK